MTFPQSLKDEIDTGGQLHKPTDWAPSYHGSGEKGCILQVRVQRTVHCIASVRLCTLVVGRVGQWDLAVVALFWKTMDRV